MVRWSETRRRDGSHRNALRVGFLGSNEICGAGRLEMILMTGGDGLSGGSFVHTDSTIGEDRRKGGVESRRWAGAGTDSAVGFREQLFG